MKTMYYRKVALIQPLTATIEKTTDEGGMEWFVISYADEERGSQVTQYFTNFWEAEATLAKMGYRGTKDATYKGVEIRWRERGIHNVLDMLHKDGYYSFLPPFPGTIYYDAATIEEAKAEIDRLEELSKC